MSYIYHLLLDNTLSSREQRSILLNLVPPNVDIYYCSYVSIGTYVDSSQYKLYKVDFKNENTFCSINL